MDATYTTTLIPPFILSFFLPFVLHFLFFFPFSLFFFLILLLSFFTPLSLSFFPFFLFLQTFGSSWTMESRWTWYQWEGTKGSNPLMWANVSNTSLLFLISLQYLTYYSLLHHYYIIFIVGCKRGRGKREKNWKRVKRGWEKEGKERRGNVQCNEENFLGSNLSSGNKFINALIKLPLKWSNNVFAP